jgi:hypothetical protein
MAYVEPTTRTTGDLITATIWNQDAVDNVKALAANRTRKFFVPAVGSSGGLVLDSGSRGFEMTDGVTTEVQGFFMVPNDYVSGMTVKPVVVADASGDARLSGTWIRGGIGGLWTSTVQAQAVFALTLDINATPYTLTEPSSLAVGDICRLVIHRFASDVSDTIGDLLNAAGWIVEYTASNYG